MPTSWKGRVGFYQSRVPSHLHVYKKRKVKRNRRFLLNAYLRCHFNRKVHFTADKWTVQSIYAIITGFRFFLMIIAISASFVTCCMSINTADFLCQCIVHVLGIVIFCFVLLVLFFWGGFFWRHCLSCPERQTDRFVYRAGDSVHSSWWTFVLFMGKTLKD